MLSNFPASYTKDMILKICEVFGKVKIIDMLKDPATGEFRGQIHVEYDTEMDAKKGFAGMMGLKVEECVLFVKRMTTISAPVTTIEGEVFKSLIEDKPTPCLMIKNIVKLEEIESRDDYKELEYDVEDEMNKYGKCLKVFVPRPPLFGDPYSVPGFGKVYVRFSNADEAEKAKHSIFRRRFNGRAVDPLYYPEEKFVKNQFD
jgi:splicing factor U2AF subunit